MFTYGAIFNNGNFVAQVRVSAKKAETHSMVTVTTDTPIENGAVITDHALLRPIEIAVAYELSNTSTDPTPYEAFNTFAALRDNRKLIELVTEHAVYKNMIVTEFTPVHNAPFKGALDCTLKLKQIGSVSSQRVQVKIAKAPKSTPQATQKTAVPKIQGGNQQPKKSGLATAIDNVAKSRENAFQKAIIGF